MYDYDQLQQTVARYANDDLCYVGSLGRSVLQREIYYFHVGSFQGPQIVLQGAIHAREHITSALLVQMMAEYRVRMAQEESLQNCGMYLIPMTNPDGVMICAKGLASVESEVLRARIARVGGDLRLFKANAELVDLNVNFDAAWGTGKQNVYSPAAENYVGAFPFSAPESRQLAEFTREVAPAATVSYHCKGEEIYWYFNTTGERRRRDRAIAQKLAQSTGYTLSDYSSAGGYKDWCIEKLQIPAFTIEVGSDAYAHPLPDSLLPQIVAQNREVPRVLLQALQATKATL